MAVRDVVPGLMHRARADGCVALDAVFVKRR